ncbi:MAG: hypothetical protein QOE24_3239, partial [Frankiales bacterium]|nr:hypothetical protein [Frankiales bacterium]
NVGSLDRVREKVLDGALELVFLCPAPSTRYDTSERS